MRQRKNAGRRLKYTLAILKKLRFSINKKKLATEPSQHIMFLGLVWDTVKWKNRLSDDTSENHQKCGK